MSCISPMLLTIIMALLSRVLIVTKKNWEIVYSIGQFPLTLIYVSIVRRVMYLICRGQLCFIAQL